VTTPEANLSSDINQCWVIGCTTTITLLPRDDCHCTYHHNNPPKGSETISHEELIADRGESV